MFAAPPPYTGETVRDSGWKEAAPNAPRPAMTTTAPVAAEDTATWPWMPPVSFMSTSMLVRLAPGVT